jgi:hypothetical protein
MGRKIREDPVRPRASGRIRVVRNQGERVGCRRNVAPTQSRRNIGSVAGAFLRNLAAMRERGCFQGKKHRTISLSFALSWNLNLGPRQFGCELQPRSNHHCAPTPLLQSGPWQA